MVVDVSNGSDGNMLNHWCGNGLEHGCNHWGDDGLLVDLCVALVGDGMWQSLHNWYGRHIGLLVDNGSHVLYNGHHWSHMANHRHYWRHMLYDGHHWSHMLDHGRDDRLIVELSEALMGGGNWCTVHHGAYLGNDGCCHHMMLLHETRCSSGNGGQGTDSDLKSWNRISQDQDPNALATYETEHFESWVFGWVAADEWLLLLKHLLRAFISSKCLPKCPSSKRKQTRAKHTTQSTKANAKQIRKLVSSQLFIISYFLHFFMRGQHWTWTGHFISGRKGSLRAEVSLRRPVSDWYGNNERSFPWVNNSNIF